MSESWKEIPGYEGLYEVSDRGRVRNRHGRVLKQCFDRDGYLMIVLCKKSQLKTWKVHRLVMAAFHHLSDLDVCHINHDKSDNTLTNLMYGTRKENMRQSVTSGWMPVTNKLTPDEALEIRNSKDVTRYLARKFGVHRSTVQHIRKGATWKHL